MNSHRLYHLTLSILLGTSLLLSTLCPLAAAQSPLVPAQKASLQSLIDLDRHYNLSFLWFDRLAVGQLSFRRDPSAPNRYRAILDAKTLGVAAWLTGERKQHYESLMEMTPQGRFVAIEYRSMIHKNKGGQVVEQTKSYKFEPATRTIFVTRHKVGQKAEEPRKIICESCPVDFLTAGFNFISGADGPLEPGVRKEILTFTEKGERNISIEVLSAANWPKTPFLKKGSGTLLKIILPTEVLDTGGGAVYALLDEKVIPQRVIVENVLGLGDVRGELRR